MTASIAFLAALVLTALFVAIILALLVLTIRAEVSRAPKHPTSERNPR